MSTHCLPWRYCAGEKRLSITLVGNKCPLLCLLLLQDFTTNYEQDSLNIFYSEEQSHKEIKSYFTIIYILLLQHFKGKIYLLF